MYKRNWIVIAGLTCSLVTGCSSFGPEKNLFGGERVTTASANQMFDKGFEGFTDEQLFQLLDPDNTCNYNKLDEAQKIKILRKAFRKANIKKTYGIPHRSQIQDRLIAASNQRCNLYMTYLKRVSTYTNGIFGTLTTVLGGAGAIVTGENTARFLSGLAGISSGTRSELTQAIFESIATSVIIPGIQKSRADLLKEIEKKRSRAVEEYTVEGAIADAISYHGACSMDTGVAYAQKSIQSYDDIGIKRFTAIQAELGIARSVSESFMLGPISSLVVTEKVLDNFSTKLDEYGGKIDSSQKSHKSIAKLHKELVTAIAKDGSLRKRAIALDKRLKVAIFNYASAIGSEKSKYLNTLKEQQIDATTFSREIETKNTELLVELKKLEK